eukprot:TRINITY_DN68739_c0_g1_i1.p1 TRINITY_DN68739_c0_g1~~TRINITY_DN68739_c0_g1_i1.p1  ORF type:complete len:477 (+),score=117.05 TRINITY_DN68739_c0_g1_i1:46-1476(+)
MNTTLPSLHRHEPAAARDPKGSTLRATWPKEPVANRGRRLQKHASETVLSRSKAEETSDEEDATEGSPTTTRLRHKGPASPGSTMASFEKRLRLGWIPTSHSDSAMRTIESLEKRLREQNKQYREEARDQKIENKRLLKELANAHSALKEEEEMLATERDPSKKSRFDQRRFIFLQRDKEMLMTEVENLKASLEKAEETLSHCDPRKGRQLRSEYEEEKQRVLEEKQRGIQLQIRLDRLTAKLRDSSQNDGDPRELTESTAVEESRAAESATSPTSRGRLTPQHYSKGEFRPSSISGGRLTPGMRGEFRPSPIPGGRLTTPFGIDVDAGSLAGSIAGTVDEECDGEYDGEVQKQLQAERLKCKKLKQEIRLLNANLDSECNAAERIARGLIEAEAAFEERIRLSEKSVKEESSALGIALARIAADAQKVEEADEAQLRVRLAALRTSSMGQQLVNERRSSQLKQALSMVSLASQLT